jgi:hypothetical protein
MRTAILLEILGKQCLLQQVRQNCNISPVEDGLRNDRAADVLHLPASNFANP